MCERGRKEGVLFTMLLNAVDLFFFFFFFSEWLATILRAASICEIQLAHLIKGASKEGSNFIDLHQGQVVHTKPFVVQYS